MAATRLTASLVTFVIAALALGLSAPVKPAAAQSSGWWGCPDGYQFEVQPANSRMRCIKREEVRYRAVSCPPAGEGPAPRIVQISSLAHRSGKIMWGNLNAEKRYSRWPFYCQSKLANLIFAKDLHRRLRKRGSNIQVMAAHPGYSATHLQDTIPGGGLFNKVMAQPAEMGCLPGVMAATSDEVVSGGYYGPDGKVLELRGYPAPAFARKITDNGGLAQRLWDESERLTGVRYLNTQGH